MQIFEFFETIGRKANKFNGSRQRKGHSRSNKANRASCYCSKNKNPHAKVTQGKGYR